MSLRTLRMKICKATKQRNARIILWLIMGSGDLMELNADNDDRELDWLGLEGGSNIMCSIL